MKTAMTFALAATVLAAGAANAQAAYETMRTTTTDTQGNTTTTVNTNYVSTTNMVPAPHTTVVGDNAGSAPDASDGSVRVKLSSGEVLTIPSNSGQPWSKDSRLQGYDRFTFDPVNNIFTAGKGEARFSENWDENGNRVRKASSTRTAKAVSPQGQATVTETSTETVTEPAAGTSASGM